MLHAFCVLSRNVPGTKRDVSRCTCFRVRIFVDAVIRRLLVGGASQCASPRRPLGREKIATRRVLKTWRVVMVENERALGASQRRGLSSFRRRPAGTS